MGQKDITEKMLADYNDVFADIVNTLLFDGRQVIHEDDLVNVKDKSQYKAGAEIHEQERDVTKLFQKNRIQIAMIGMEDQTEVDPDEVFRVLGYDGASYRRQLLSGQKERYPVVTLVLYFGTTRWNKATSLHEALNIGEEWKPFVSDYKINLFEVAFLEPEQVQKFQSDFRIVADYFVQMRTNRNYKPSKETIRHTDEILKLMGVLLNDSRFLEVQNNEKGGLSNMCEVLDRVEAKGKAEGLAEGKAEGLAEGLAKGKAEGKIIAYYDVGYSVKQIAEKVGISEEKVQEILALQ